MLRTTRHVAVFVGAGLIALASCGSDADVVPDVDSARVEAAVPSMVAFIDPWSREPVSGQTTSAVYGTIVNNGSTAIKAIAARASVADRAELHEVLVGTDGVMTMQQRPDGFAVAAGESLILEPGSFHVMLMGIDPVTYPSMVRVEIDFDDGTTLGIVAPVRSVEGQMKMDDDVGVSISVESGS